jgi:hypothetical protein
LTKTGQNETGLLNVVKARGLRQIEAFGRQLQVVESTTSWAIAGSAPGGLRSLKHAFRQIGAQALAAHSERAQR